DGRAAANPLSGRFTTVVLCCRHFQGWPGEPGLYMIDASAPVKILLVENNQRDATLILDTLGRARPFRFELIHVEDLEEASKRLRSETHIDIILLDLSLQDSHGMHTLTRMQEIARRIPIVVLADLDDSGVAMKAVREGA